MAKVVSSFELPLKERRPGQTLATWIYGELRAAILEGRLRHGAKLPASRDFARQYGVSRGTVVSAFERLQDEGYLASQVGTGTWVSATVPGRSLRSESAHMPPYAKRAVSNYQLPKPFINWIKFNEPRPFGMSYPALADFPAALWGRMAARRSRAFHTWLHERDDGCGYQPLRQAIANYLGASRGVRCDPDQVVIVSGIQESLDLLARLLLKPGDQVWMEDPGYFGASIAFQRAEAEIVPVPVDEQGLCVAAGKRAGAHARGVYLTPAHQYPLGVTMSLERRIEVLTWAKSAGAFIIEDDYDSEYRFDGAPSPALQGLDRHSSVILVGTFTKLLFPSLRLGYVVLPPGLVDVFVSFRRETDLRSTGLDQAILSDFIAEGYFGRHLRRMRDLYACRLEALIDYGRQYLSGMLEISDVRAGLYTAAFLRNGMGSREAESAAAAKGVETRALDRFTLKRVDPQGLLLGFAAFNERTIREGVRRLASALGTRNSGRHD